MPELPFEIWKERIDNELNNIEKLNVLENSSVKRSTDFTELILNINGLGFIMKNSELLPKEFHKIYTQGKTLYSSGKKIKLNYFMESSVNEVGIKAAFVVSRKSGNAVWRNRVKRLLRESFRLNRHGLYELCCSKNVLLLLCLSPGSINQRQFKKIGLGFILDDVIDVLKKLQSKVEDE